LNPLISKALSEGRSVLLEPEAKELCSSYGIPTPRFKVASSPAEAVEAAKSIGLPVVVKIVSKDILHKSDVGCVELNVNTYQGVEEAYRRVVENALRHNPNAEVRGVLVEEMLPRGVEVAVGSIRDLEFGPAVMFGLGGVFIEVLRDVTFRVAPVSEEEAEEMIAEVKGFKVLTGYRGAEPVDLKCIAKIIAKVSEMVLENEEISQLDLNPIMAWSSGAKVADARVILSV